MTSCSKSTPVFESCRRRRRYSAFGNWRFCFSRDKSSNQSHCVRCLYELETSPVSALAEQLFSGQRHRVGQRLAHLTIRVHFAAHRVPTLRRFLKSYAGRAGICSDDVRPELTLEKRQQLMEAHLGLKAFPGVPPALKSLQDVGIKLAFLSNMAPHMLESATKSSARWNF
jgi:hypothetical protein